MKSVRIGGRDVIAFVEVSELRSNHITSVEPIPTDGATGYSFDAGKTRSVNIWGVDSQRGKRIAAAYRAGELPTDDVFELNEVLRPDEF